jgi:ATP-dependent DNA helicase PIF1
MLEPNRFRGLDRVCRAARPRDRPFGGMQVVVIGDFYQFPSVKPFFTCFDCGVELKTRALCRGCQASAGEREDLYQS